MPKEIELFAGLFFILFSVIMTVPEIIKWNKRNKEFDVIKPLRLKIILSGVVMFLVGIAGVFRYFN